MNNWSGLPCQGADLLTDALCHGVIFSLSPPASPSSYILTFLQIITSVVILESGMPGNGWVVLYEVWPPSCLASICNCRDKESASTNSLLITQGRPSTNGFKWQLLQVLGSNNQLTHPLQSHFLNCTSTTLGNGLFLYFSEEFTHFFLGAPGNVLLKQSSDNFTVKLWLLSAYTVR